MDNLNVQESIMIEIGNTDFVVAEKVNATALEIDLSDVPKTPTELAEGRHMALIRDLSNKYRKSFAKVGLDAEDMVQEGYIQLAGKLPVYDPTRGAKFGTWAYHVISNFFRNKIKTSHDYVPMSLNAVFEENEQNGRSDKHKSPGILDNKAIDPAESVSMQLDWEQIQDDLAQFGDREREILRLRFTEGMTLQQIGVVFGITRERVRQIEAGCLQILRKKLNVVLDDVVEADAE